MAVADDDDESTRRKCVLVCDFARLPELTRSRVAHFGKENVFLVLHSKKISPAAQRGLRRATRAALYYGRRFPCGTLSCATLSDNDSVVGRAVCCNSVHAAGPAPARYSHW